MELSRSLQRAIAAHAAREHPRECCGLIVRGVRQRRYVACRNAAGSPSEHFVIDHQDWCAAEDQGEVLAIVHSHPDVPATPSMADRVSCELHGLPWVILSWPEGDVAHLAPEGYRAPLLGREFAHGVLDCWSLCRDWYRREAGLELPDYPRRDGWWETGESLYEQHYAAAGFRPVPLAGIRRGDMLVMQVGRALHPNHAGIYLGNDWRLDSEPVQALGGDGPFLLHHLCGRLSTRDVFGGPWIERTRLVLRHTRMPQ
ncbi:C40 family peptidase [Pseudomonas aeruginosa]